MRKAKVFQNGQSQAIRLPKEFRVKGSEVFIKKQGNTIVLIPMDTNPWESLIVSLDQFSEDYLEERDQPVQAKREKLFP